MRFLTIKMSLVCALMAVLFAACEQDSILDNTLNSAENALQKATETTPNALANMVQQRRGAANSETVNVFQNSRTASTEAEVQKAVSEATIMDIQASTLAELRTAAPGAIQLAIPTVKSKNFELDLVQVDLFAPGFEVVDQTGAVVRGDLGVHYQGIIKGDNNSLAAISIYEDQVMGFFSNEDGNYVLGKLEDERAENTHIVYLDTDLTDVPEGAGCTMPDGPNPAYSDEIIRGDFEMGENRAVGSIGVFLEVAEDIYYRYGTGTNSFIAGLFNQSAVLYANEQVTIQISDMLVWTSPSGYNSQNSYTQLLTFQSRYNNSNRFNGDIGHLLSFTGSGGIAAGFNGLCNAEVDNSMCFSGIHTYYYNVPTFSWSVYVVTHEMGHLFGSYHTHACAWNGNNTAIDGCAGFVEGNCYLPGPAPVGTGTIMSYCHFYSGGIGFNYGFGPQPGNVIRANAAQTSGGGELEGWKYFTQLGSIYFYGSSWPNWAWIDDIGYVYVRPGQISSGGGCAGGEPQVITVDGGVWFQTYFTATVCGEPGSSWFWDYYHGDNALWSGAKWQWVNCGNQGLAAEDNGDTLTPEHVSRSAEEPLRFDFEKYNAIIAKMDVSKLPPVPNR